MNHLIESRLLDYGVLGIVVVMFAGVIVFLYHKFSETLLRMERDKNSQIESLKDDIRDMRIEARGVLSSCSESVRENTSIIRYVADVLERVNKAVDNNTEYYKRLLERDLEK